jgi:transposase-like protein
MNASDLIKILPKTSCEQGAVHIWHLDAVYLKIAVRMVDLRRAVDEEGEVLDVLVQSKRNKHATLKLMRKLLKKHSFVPDRMITDDLRSSSATLGSKLATSAVDGSCPPTPPSTTLSTLSVI